MGSAGSGASAPAASAPAAPQVGMLATTPQNIPLNPETPQTLGLDPSANPQVQQQMLGWQPLATK